MNFLGGIVYTLLSYSTWYGRICCPTATTAIPLLGTTVVDPPLHDMISVHVALVAPL